MPKYEVKIVRHARSAEVCYTEIEADDEQGAIDKAVERAFDGDESLKFEPDDNYYYCDETEVEYCEPIEE